MNSINSLREKHGISFDYRDKNVIPRGKPLKEITELLQSNKCLLLCDGGNKIKEFNIYSNYLSTGSYIMAHDYAPNREYFLENINKKRWNWFEIEDSDVEDTMKKNRLTKSIYDKYFTQVAWVQCRKKRSYVSSTSKK